MYPGKHAAAKADQACFIMAGSGEVVTWGEYEARTNRLAHLLRSHGLGQRDHYAVFMENNAHYCEACGAAARAGLYYTCINSYLTPEEVAFIINDSDSQLLITSQAKREVALAAVEQCPQVKQVLVVGGGDGAEGAVVDFEAATARFPATPISDEWLGTSMLYSSGTTGRPKGILRPLPDQPPSEPLLLYQFLTDLWQFREDMVYLSPAPLYHSAPNASVSLTIRVGGTSIIMEKFDPEQYLALVERYRVTHSQLVPTMFSRMLKLPEAVRSKYDVSSLEYVVHAAAPCPVQVKQAMIDWWGPIIHEYYGATEGLGFSYCNAEEWLAHPGTVGKIMLGELQVLDDDMQPVPTGEPGTLWFRSGTPFEYYKNPDKTAESRSSNGELCTVNDVGYVDEEGYLYLTDRKTFMIISGGVNIYPQETENLLITHPKVADAAVFGVPNEDLGEEVKAVVQVMPGETPGAALEQELIVFCRANLSHIKCPRSIDFEDELPRLPTGKLYKRLLRDRYWGKHDSRIV
ncbi:MAG: AMP-binding protein [Gammaproteobacteria bacterium]|nr:AMP-binding protein [Gammaproteobacteria bacterium]